MPTSEWRGELGRAYTDRCLRPGAQLDELYRAELGVSRSEVNRAILSGVDRSASVLECGANTGAQLELLRAMGFSNLHAVEVQGYAIARRQRGVALYAQASILDLPFPDGAFDLVFTSRVLIHVPPPDLPRAMAEVCRVSRRYVWGWEYYAPELQEIPWRGRRDMLWKGDYARMYREQLPLHRVRHVLIGYRENANLDATFLLEKIP